MRQFCTSSLVSMVFLLLVSVVAKAEVADRIVAVVNDDIITLSELNEEGGRYFQELIKRAPADRLQSEMEKLRQEVLSHLIDQRLIDQQAAKLDVKISEEEISQTVNNILTENNVSHEDMKRDLASRGITEEQYRKQLKGQMLQSRLINYEIRSKVVVTDEKINQYYKENFAAQQGGASGFHLLQMGFLWGGENQKKSAAEARQAAESAKSLLDAGKNFTEVAGELSDLPSKVDGGDIGVFQTKELAASMKDIVLAMKPGETSGILETQNGYQIIKLISVQDGDQVSAPPLVEVKKEIEAQLYKQESEQLYKKWLTELRGHAFIKQNM